VFLGDDIDSQIKAGLDIENNTLSSAQTLAFDKELSDFLKQPEL